MNFRSELADAWLTRGLQRTGEASQVGGFMKVSEVKIPGETNSVNVDAWPDAKASERGDHGRVWLWCLCFL